VGVRDLPQVVHNHCGTGIGRPHHGALQLQRPQPGNVQVLVKRHRVAKPSEVAEVDHDRGGLGRICKTLGQLFAKQVFIANVGRNPLARPLERRLTERAPVEVTQGDVHHLHEPLGQRGNELAKRHKVVLGIAVDGPRAFVQVGG
jgi:hypothetical protein